MGFRISSYVVNVKLRLFLSFSKTGGNSKYARDSCYKYTPKSNSWTQTTGTMKIDRTHGGSDYHPNWGLVMIGGIRYKTIL